MMNKQAFLFAVLLGVVASESITFKPCTNTEYDGVPTKVELSPCPSQPCYFKHGQTVDVKITFVARQDETSMKAAIHGLVFGLPINWPMPNSDGCNDQGIMCPIKKGETYTYHSSFKVLDIYPKIRLTVRWQLDGGASQFCFQFPMAIVDGTPEPEVGK